MHVLVTDDSYNHALGIVRSLGSKGIRVSVLADHGKALASNSRYCSARYLVPPAEGDSFIPAVIDILRQNHIDLVIPVGYAPTVALAKHKAALSGLTKLEVADYERIRAAADKRYVNDLALALGVPAPRTASPRNLDEAVSLSAELKYPVVIKAPGEAVNKNGVDYARDRSELIAHYRRLGERQNGGLSPLPMIQEYIPGVGCGFFAAYQHGVCKRMFMHRRVRETPPRGGISCCAASYYDPKLKEYGTRLLDRLEWHGVAMVEFRQDERDGSYKLMEINPKFWGSLDLALASGVDFPYYLCQMARGQTLEYSEEYDRNVCFHWPLLEMRHLMRRPVSIGAVLAGFLDPRVRSNISWHDLKPNLLEPFSRLRALVSQRMIHGDRRRDLPASVPQLREKEWV